MLKNFLWQREDQPQNMLSYLFLLMNFAYGVQFTLFRDSPVVQNSAFAMEGLPPLAWGVLCLALVFLTLTSIALRPRGLGEAVGFLGFIVWSYGFCLYVAAGVPFAAFAIYLPQMLFWTFWYIGVKRFFYRENLAK